LTRKLKALKGKSAGNYLKAVRLSKAGKLIVEGGWNVSKTAYTAGFSSPAYFSSCFIEEYNFPPDDLVS
jgi:AraC-like DNA-binding protein